MTTTVGSNWAESYEYRARRLHRPTTVDEIRRIVAGSPRIRALGTRHSFTDVADSPGDLVSLDSLNLDLVIDAEARTASFSPGVRYGDLATELQARGWAIHNLASLPHISVAGAVATATHGSGDRNGTLAAVVAGLEFVNASGEIVRLTRGDADLAGAVVAVGALGILTRITLDIEPTFDVRQDLYNGLPWDVLFENFDAITGSAYSVSLFTNWVGDSIDIAWLKSRTDDPTPPPEFFGAQRQSHDQHMIPGQRVENTTQQSGVPGPWNERLAHFKLGFTPSNGDELQSEFLVPRRNIIPALRAVRELGDRIAPLLLVSELRTMRADEMWLSGAYDTDAVGIHFTWKKAPSEVRALLIDIEAVLIPLAARPHWGKVFESGVDQLAPLYPRLRDFISLARTHDPGGKFRNDFLARKLGLN